jgi:serine/threonine-protein kinase RsbT
MLARAVVQVVTDRDIVTARVRGRLLASELGFQMGDLVVIATAISEVARNIVRYATQGGVEIEPLDDGRHRGIQIVARDQGPGIGDVALALEDGYTTGGGLGVGLPGCRRLMDDFEITSSAGQGTTVVMRKWLD